MPSKKSTGNKQAASNKNTSKAAPKSSKKGSKGKNKKVEKEPQVKRSDPLFPARPKNYRIGGTILRNDRNLTRFVRWPRYIRLQRQKKILMQRLKVPPSINQFKNTINKNQATELFKLLSKYKPETKAEKLNRQRNLAMKIEESKDPINLPKPRPMIKFGLHHVTNLIERQKAKLVVIAHDVDPIELVVWLPALCRKMDVPYCIVKSKARLGTLVHQKTASVVCLTEVESKDEHTLNQLATNFNGLFNENIDSYRKWGGGIMGIKTRTKLAKRQEAIEAVAAKQQVAFRK